MTHTFLELGYIFSFKILFNRRLTDFSSNFSLYIFFRANDGIDRESSKVAEGIAVCHPLTFSALGTYLCMCRIFLLPHERNHRCPSHARINFTKNLVKCVCA